MTRPFFILFIIYCINNTMRAKEFILEYAIGNKTDFTQISAPCDACHGTGNTDTGGGSETCQACKGVGTQDKTDNTGYAMDKDHQSLQGTYAGGGF